MTSSRSELSRVPAYLLHPCPRFLERTAHAGRSGAAGNGPARNAGFRTQERQGRFVEQRRMALQVSKRTVLGLFSRTHAFEHQVSCYAVRVMKRDTFMRQRLG